MNAIARALMLFWIEFRRCQGIFVAPVLAALTIWFVGDRIDRAGVVLWRDVSMEVAYWAFVIGSGGAAFAVWVVDRSRRRRMRDQEAMLPVPQGRTTLLSMLAVLAWMLVTYAAVFAWFAVPALRFATWGGPDWSLLLIGALTISVCVGFGAVVGWFGRAPILAPLTLLLVYGGNVYAADSMYGSEPGVLVPIRLFDDFRIVGRFSMPGELIWSMVGWLGALTLLLGVVVLVLRQRSLVRLVGCAVAAVLVIAGANQVLAERDTPRDLRPETMILADLDCQQTNAIEVCVHPAFSSLLDEFLAAADHVYGPLAGLPGLPERLIGGEANIGDVERTGSSYVWFHDRNSIGFSVAGSLENVFSRANRETGLITASQCVIVDALSLTRFPTHCAAGYVTENAAIQQPGPHRGGGEWADKILVKVDTFSALTPDEQRAWLEAHWIDLCAGNIALDEMP